MSLRQNIELLIEITKKDLKIRYKNAFLGYLWSVASPLTFAAVYYFAFKVVMRTRTENFSLFLIAGLFPWQWFANSVTTSATVFLANKTLIQKTTLPRVLLVLASILNGAIHFFLSIPVILVFLLVAHMRPSVAWIWGIPAMMIPQFLIILGLCLLVASLNVFFRDLQHLIGVLVLMLFWFTPIVYPHTSIPKSIKPFVYLNPMMPVVVGYRTLFLEGRFSLRYCLLSLVSSILLVAIGYSIYLKLRWKFAELL